MQVLIAVIEDLFRFAIRALSGAMPYSHSIELIDEYDYKESQRHHSDVPALPSSYLILPSGGLLPQEILQYGEQYFVGTTDTFMYQDPVIAFDNALMKLTYGQKVRLLQLQGRWAHVRLAGIVGWVLKDTLRVKITDVYPDFKKGIVYDAEHTETKKLRACISDAFNGGVSGHTLSSAEYVHYCLQQQKLQIDWGDIRMRVPGTWQRKLRGRFGIHMGVTPKKNTVMEYIIDNIGHLAFIENILSDNRIMITEIGKYADAMYSNECMTMTQWRELQPVFIEVIK